MCVKYIPIQCRIATFQPYRVLANITPRIRVVISKPIVIQSSLRILVLPLILERYEGGWPFPLPPVDVQLLLPHLVALLVVGLQRRAEVVGDDGETLAIGNKLGGRHERVLFEEPSDHLIFFRPFVQWHVAVPNEVGGRSCVCLADAAAEGVVCERDLLAVGTNDAGEHAVALPIITPARAEGAETDAQFSLEPLLINRGDDVAAPRQLLKLLEHEVAFAVVVLEMFAVFGQPASVIFAVVLLTRLEEVARAVGYAVEAFHLAAFVLGRDEVVELVVVVPRHASRALVSRHQQAVAHVPRITYSFIQNAFAVPLHNAYFDTCFGTHLFYSFKNIVFFLS